MRLTIPASAGVFTLLATLLTSGLDAQTTANPYLRYNLIADTASQGADLVDPNLINPWGNVTTAASPFWVSDTGSGLSTVYTSSATALSISGTKPAVPAAGGASKGTPTGIVIGNGSFPIKTGVNSSFIFDTLDGTISAWAAGADPNNAVVMVDNSKSNAVYTGLALGGTASNQLLYAANYYSGAIEVYDSTFKPVSMPGAFVDAQLPAGYVPFNIWPLTVGGTTRLYVAYTKQDASKKDYTATIGAGVGYVDAYDMNGALVQRVTGGGVLNAPWGLAIAPANFGKFAGMLLVGNFGDGRIDAFDPSTGTSLGPLMDNSGTPIAISGLWAIIAGNGGSGGDTSAIYYTAGTGGQQHGVLGVIQSIPVINNAGIVNAASGASNCAANTIITIYGPNLAPRARNWQESDFNDGALPTSLNKVSVMVDGKPAYVSFISPKQINVLIPQDSNTGSVQVQVTNNGLVSAVANVQLSAAAPAFFIYKNNEIAALHSDNVSVVGDPTLFPNSSTPAKAGETIVLFGTGFGATTPAYPGGQIVTQPYPLTTMPTVTIGGNAATVTFAGLTGAGLYQINVTVPAGTASGMQPVVATINGVSTQSSAVIAVQ